MNIYNALDESYKQIFCIFYDLKSQKNLKFFVINYDKLQKNLSTFEHNYNIIINNNFISSSDLNKILLLKENVNLIKQKKFFEINKNFNYDDLIEYRILSYFGDLI